jgi:AcrR family transcriptional regulator
MSRVAYRRRAASAGVNSNDAGRATRQRIMSVAERLFARKGLDAVSIRDITAAADANTAAIHYHFGSKQDLIEAILERRATEVDKRRSELLNELDRMREPTLRDVVAAFVVPTAELAADKRHGGRHYIGFLAAVLSHAEYMPLVVRAWEPETDRYLAALQRVTPHLSREVLEFRWAVAKDITNRVLGNPNGPIHVWLERRAPGADQPLTERLIDFLVGAFSAPVDG